LFHSTVLLLTQDYTEYQVMLKCLISSDPYHSSCPISLLCTKSSWPTRLPTCAVLQHAW